MAINPSIVFGLKPAPVFDPLEQSAKALNLVHGVQQLRGQQQQMEAGALDLEEKKQAIADNQTLRQLAAEHGADFDKIIAGAAGRVSPKVLASLQQAATEHKTKMAGLTQSELANLAAKNKLVAERAGVFVQKPVDQQALEYPAERQWYIDNGLAKPEELPVPYPGAAATQNFYETHAGAVHMFDMEKKRKDEERAAAGELRAQEKSNMEAVEFGARFPGVQADTQHKIDVAAGKEPIQPAQQATIDATAAQHAATNANEQSRIELEKKRVSLDAARNAREQSIYQQTYGEGSNDALRGVEPKLRTQATSQAQKVGAEYQNAQRAADDLESMIHLIHSGNKAAGSNLPIVGVGALNAINGIKRFNRTEIEQYGGAGSLLDRIQGKIGKIVEGKPIPDDVLKDIEEMHKTLRDNSEKTYRSQLEGINHNYHSNFTPPAKAVKVEAGIPDAVKKALSGAGAGLHTLSDGSKWLTAADGTITKQ